MVLIFNTSRNKKDINIILFYIDDDQMQRRLLCDKGHLLEIETTFVTRAVREFVERYHFVKLAETPQTFQEKLIQKKSVVSRSITTEEVTNFWKRYNEIFPAKKERLWDGLLVGLKKYHEVLKERHHLNVETESLRRQNTELRRLLKTYVIEVILLIFNVYMYTYKVTGEMGLSTQYKTLQT